MIKKMCAFFLAIILIMSCTLIAFAIGDEIEILPASGFALGDVNMDKSVNIKDATAVQKHLADIATLDEIQLLLADADQNSSVNVKDATYIQKQVAGLVPPAAIKPPVTDVTTSTFEDLTQAATSIVAFSSVSVSTEVTSSSVKETVVTTEIATSLQPTDITTEVPTSAFETETTSSQIPTQTPASTTEVPTEKPTRDPDKPIELPFIPVP